MSMVGFPLLLIPLAIFNIIVFLMPGVSLSAPVFTLALMSGVSWTVTLGDIFLAGGIFLLMLEIIKGARPGGKYLMDHLLSLILLGGAAAEFVLLPQFGNSTYFLLTTLAFVDFVSGIALRTRRPRRVAPVVAPAEQTRVQEPRAETIKPQETVRTEPRVDVPPAPTPAPAPTPRPPEPVVITPPPEPEVLLPAPTPPPANDPSPQVPSPGLQPASEPRPSGDTPPRESPKF
jgi:hypothetical protein